MTARCFALIPLPGTACQPYWGPWAWLHARACRDQRATFCSVAPLPVPPRNRCETFVARCEGGAP